MLRINWLYRAVCVMAVCVSLTTVTSASITVTSDVDPADDPSTWTSGTVVCIGKTGYGAMDITDGSDVFSNSSSCVGYWFGSTGEVTVDGVGSTWTVDDSFSMAGFSIGWYGNAALNITNGGEVNFDCNCLISRQFTSNSVVTVDGAGSKLIAKFLSGGEGLSSLNITRGGEVNCSDRFDSHGMGMGGPIFVTVDGAGSKLHTSEFSIKSAGSTLNITNGGAIYSYSSRISNDWGPGTYMIVDGVGSTWMSSHLELCDNSRLEITEGGFIRANVLVINNYGSGNGSIRMSTSGMLALAGDADDSLADFLNLIGGTDDIRYWDDLTSSWDNITNATWGEDYWLAYMPTGDLAGCTVLTVTASGPAPEPATLSLLVLGGLAMLRRRRK